MSETFIWFISILLILIGLLGCVIPGLPGAPLILGGALIHKLGLPDILSWWTIGVLCLMALLAAGLNILVTGYTAQKAGASRLGTFAAIFGAIIGLWMSFLWIFLLPLLLAFGVEYGIKKKKAQDAAAISAKVGLGLLFSAVLQIGIAFSMIAALIVDWLWL